MTLKEYYEDKVDTTCYFGYDEPGEFGGYTLDEIDDELWQFTEIDHSWVIEEKFGLLLDSLCELYKIPNNDLKSFFKAKDRSTLDFLCELYKIPDNDIKFFYKEIKSLADERY